mgnify:CR=1 FL=1
MARQAINIGSSANDGTGDPLRTAFDKINDNFVELYGTDDDSKTLANNLDVNGHNIISSRSNEDIKILPAGTGGVIASAVRIAGTTISSDDSSLININEGLVVDGTLNVSGAATITGATTLSTSLALATGATVTGIDNGALGSSATLLATQGAIKTYVDSQVTAQDLDLAGDSGTGAVDLDSQSLTIAGGTGLTSVAGSQTVSLNIDSTVATLTGSQTLTNKVLTAPTINAATMTGTVTVDSISMADNTITTGASNANLELDASGTGSVRLIAPTTAVSTLTTADIATVGTHTITGQLDAEGVRIKDNTITTNATNANLELSANGTGVVDVKDAMTTVGQTITGNVVVTGRLDIDNLAFTGNNITATNSNGGILLNPQGTGSITLGGNTVNVPSILTAHTVFVDSEMKLGPAAKISPSVTNDDVLIEANGTGSVVLEQVSITANKITTHVSNADLQIDTDGTGFIDVLTDTQATVGSAGGASALPGQPTGYIKIKIAGTLRVIPFYDQA